MAVIEGNCGYIWIIVFLEGKVDDCCSEWTIHPDGESAHIIFTLNIRAIRLPRELEFKRGERNGDRQGGYNIILCPGGRPGARSRSVKTRS